MLLLSTTRCITNQTQDAHCTQRMPSLAEQTGSRSLMPVALLQPLRYWLTEIEIRDRKLARMLCFLIPAQCPFERTFTLFGRTILAIPPLCKLNPFYDELVALRFRSLCYLVEVLGDDRFC